MKRFLLALMIVFSVLSFAACDPKEDIGGNGGGGGGGGEPAAIVMSEVPETASAELGERFDLPEVTAKQGDKDVAVTVSVKDSNGEEVELQGRGTRFSATDLGGYTVTFTAGTGESAVVKTMTVTVTDSKGPELVLPAAASGMTVTKGGTVYLPSYEWTDKSGEVTDLGYKVTFGGSEVQVTTGGGDLPDSFVATEYGDYIVTFRAQDKFENITETSVTVQCVRSVVLADFNDGSGVWGAGLGEAETPGKVSSSFVEEHAVEGNALKLNCDGGFNLVAVYPDFYDLSGFDKFQITIYASADMNTSDEGFYLLNQKYPLSEGENVITISKEEFDAQYPGCVVPSTQRAEYYDLPYIWFQVKSATATVWLDHLIGIFDNFTEDKADPVIDFGQTVIRNHLTLMEGNILTPPTASVYDNSMEELSATVKVVNSAGEDITAQVSGGNFRAQRDEVYEIVYEAADSAGNKGSKTVTVEVTPRATIPDTPAAEYFPKEGIYYDMLQDFEGEAGSGVPGITFTSGNVTASVETTHVMHGTNSAGAFTTSQDTIIVITLTKNGKRLTDSDWNKYQYIRAYVYSDVEGARFDFYGNTHDLEVGPNVIDITPAEILAEIAKADNVYDTMGGFYFQLTTGTVYIDAIIGVYPEGYDPETDVPEPDVPIPDTSAEEYFPDGRTYDMLNDLEDSGVDWCSVEKSFSEEHVMSGQKSAKFSTSGDSQGFVMKLLKDGKRLEESDWLKYEYIQVYVYCESETARFDFYGNTHQLKKGPNTVTITPLEILAEIAKSGTVYDATGGFLFQLTMGTIYVDAIIGVYPDSSVGDLDTPSEEYFPADRIYDTLNDFEGTGVDWCVPEHSYSTLHAMSGNGSVKLSTSGDSQCVVMKILKDGKRLEESDWNKYDYIQVYVYSESDTARFDFYGNTHQLQKGPNTITITPAEILTEIAKSGTVYDATGGFYFQLTMGTVYVDAIIGVYPEGYEPGTDVPEPEVPIPDTSAEEYFPDGRTYDMLNDLEGTGVDWCIPEKEFTQEHVMHGDYSVKLSTSNADQCVVMKLLKDGKRLEESDWNKYEYIRVYVYCESDTARFDFYGNTHQLQKGPNTVTITPAEILTEIAKNPQTVYDTTGGFYFQLTMGTVYVDAIIGIYPEGYTPGEPEEPQLPDEVKNYFPTDRKYDVLQDFEDASAIDTWFFQESEGVTTDHAIKGHAFHVSGDADWGKLPITMKKNGNLLTEDDWKAYETIKLCIYSEGTGKFAYLNNMYSLTEGYNVITISGQEMYDIVSSREDCYPATGAFFCQLNGAGMSIYLDALIGIYPAE